MQTIVDNFANKIIEYGIYKSMDQIYIKNRILALIGEEGTDKISNESDLKKLKDNLVEIALKNGKIADLAETKECLGAELMNFIVPLPSRLNDIFWSSYDVSPQEAVEEFYQLSKDSDYIKLSAIAKNIAFHTETNYGSLEITINLSKPEKDPKTIAAEKLVKSSNYPKCLLCMENEGYQGRINYPARANHRIIRLELGDEVWGFQYSPYSYFNEHAIFLNSQHVPMAITSKTFEQLLEIVDILPGYFAGSNSDLPISGGSILSHNHYQGGKHIFPMEKAKFEREFLFKDFEDVKAGIVKWPMSVIRLQGKDIDRIVEASDHILSLWRGYTDEDAFVFAETDGTMHNTITPIARMHGDLYEIDLVLRNNITTDESPWGVYHPSADLHHIKKENIGLIEVMGLAVLPARLKKEMALLEEYILSKKDLRSSEELEKHADWVDGWINNHDINSENIHGIVQDEISKVFVKVLECAGVYKRDEKGQEAFDRFVKTL